MNYFIYFTLVFSSVFQDFFLVNYIGEFGRSITAIITIPMFILYIILNKKKIVINKNIKILIKLGLYLLFINMIALSKYLIIDLGNIGILDENVVIQTIKGYIYFANIVIFMILIYNLQKNIKKEDVFKPFVFTFIFLFFVLIIESMNIPNALPMLHNEFPYYRVRLTTSESSWTSSIIVIYFALSYYYYKYIKSNKLMRILSVFICVIFIFNSSSKGLIIALLVTILIMILIDSNMKTKIVSIFMVGIIMTLIVPSIQESILSDLRNYTSIVTRSYSILIGIIYIILNPFGTGNALYLIKYPEMLNRYINLFNNVNFKFNLSEIYTYIRATTSQNISAKSAFVQYGLYWGIVGTLMMIYFLINIYKDAFKSKDKKYTVIKFAYINTLILLITTISFDIKYEVWILFSVVIYLGENKTV